MLIKVEGIREDGSTEFTTEGAAFDVVVPLLAQLTPEQAGRAFADAMALRAGRLLDSTVEAMKACGPRGTIKPIELPGSIDVGANGDPL